MFDTPNVPSLPNEIPLDDAPPAEGLTTGPETVRPNRIETQFAGFPFRVHALRQGAYFLQWQPKTSPFIRYNGTMRIERHPAGATASGDLYTHQAFRIVTFPTFKFIPNPDPSPSAGIPTYSRGNYRFYLEVTQVLEFLTLSKSFTLGFNLYELEASTNAWTNLGAHTAKMVFKPTPAAYPSGATYLEGTLTAPGGVDAGTLRMGWVSPYLRKAVLEVDRFADSEYPADSGTGVDWHDVFEAVNWDVRVYESDANLPEPSGESWSDAEMHSAMLARRDAASLDSEWRYHLLCVRRLDSTSRGIMYDAFGGDSNNIPREGAALSSHWMIPNDAIWGTVQGLRFGTAAAPYFRTAVHEIGHAFGLYHNTADNGFMNTTDVIASSPGVFPANIQWSFNGEDAKRLRHMPDPWVRPGMIPFGQPYGSTPISPTDMIDLGGPLALRVEPLLESVPIGAPVRVTLMLTNRSDSPIEVPHTLSLKGEHVSGRVRDASSMAARSFRSVMRCVEEHQTRVLGPGESMSEDMTLIRGREGALFPSPGLHRIDVDVIWEIGGVEVRISGGTSVMVTPPVDASHADAARRTLTEPDLLLTVAIGGDHLEDGNAALAVAMKDDTLAPHYAVIAAKQAGRRFGKRKADPEKAVELLGSNPIASSSEMHRITTLVGDAGEAAIKKMGRKAVAGAGKAAPAERA